MTFRPTGWLLYALLSILTVPALVYICGRLLAGPYEGKFGLLGLMGNLYGDALLLKPGAWFILFAPLLLVAVWWGSFTLCRKLGDSEAAIQKQGQQTRPQRKAPSYNNAD